ncbi:MAG: hypothetical protein HFJ50_05250 [Clostridia bacterium]|jgi:site-specific DNA recombinase|nr:hypothetical protein [Clostridia bacterium]
MNKYETNYITKTCKKNKNRDSWIIKENTHEPIIEKKKYDKVQEIKLSKQSKIKVKHEYLLRDLLYCGDCKRKMQYKICKSGDKQRFLYESSGFNCSVFYKKRCKNKTYIRETDLNQIIKNEVVKRLKLIKADEAINKLNRYYKENDEEMKRIEEYKDEIKKLERKKSILYKKKCEEYITIEEFKIEYVRAKDEIDRLENLIEDFTKNKSNRIEEKKLKQLINEFKNGNSINNEFLREIVNKIEIYSKDKIKINFNL